MLLAHPSQHHFEVVQELVEGANMPASPARQTVSPLIIGVNGTTPACKPGPEPIVATAVLGETVYDQESPLGLGR